MSFTHRCWAEINLDALRANLAWWRYRIGPNRKILSVVKADGYGHGLRQVAALLMQAGTDIFGVANLQEARDIRAVGRGFPILMLGACLPDEVDAALHENVIPTLSTLAEARAFSRAAGRLGRTVQAHLKVDTGMGRLGAPADTVPKLLRTIDRLTNLRVVGLYTHYAAAEDDAAFSRHQRRVFEKLVKHLADAGRTFDALHANNSAALLHETDGPCNLARPGLLVYGVIPPGRRSPGRRREQALLKRHLRPALSWKCRVTLVKTIEAGTSLSYGRSFIAPCRMRVATLSAGYGDGFLRSGSGRAHVLVGGRLRPVLGRVTMDQMLVDVSRGRVRPGDEAVLIGRQGRSDITAGELAQWCGTVPWEILTAITYRVPRIYCGGSAA